ncbi:MAG TPA: phenylalanine 4-monooxygenase [Saprospiraceae bacterium]|nr:phenylalanine 4-monooxygenase [Saprospiraceae bacterium]
MEQNYNNYTAADHEVWRILFSRQTENLQDKACPEYMHCLTQMSDVMHRDAIPDFCKMDELLMQTVSWQIEVVPGHIPVRDFFELLAQRRFPSSTWLRPITQLDYLEEPDMFHDIYGHIPLLMDPRYADFMHAFGQLGHKYIDNEKAVSALRSLYWFTIEFGLLVSQGKRRIYGAGILSSYGESKSIYHHETMLHPFSIRRILETEFRTDVMQSQYFVAESMDEFLQCLKVTKDVLHHLPVVMT